MNIYWILQISHVIDCLGTIKSKAQSLMDLYKKFRNRIYESLRESKASYFYDYFHKNSNRMKQLWSGIKSVISIRKSSNVHVISKLKDKNCNITSDPAVIANIFSNFLCYFFSLYHQKFTNNQQVTCKFHGWQKWKFLFALPLQLLMEHPISSLL